MIRRETPDIMGAVLAGSDQPAASSLRIADIRRDGGTQPRAGLDESHVADLVAALAAGDTLPPVDVMHDGTAYWLYDGYHRVEAASRAGRYTVMATIHQGTQVAAQWASYAANGKHGLKRTNEDKRRAVLAALRHPNAATMSNVQIAAHVGVDEGTIRNYRAQMETSSEIPKMLERTVSRGGQTYTQNTERIGASRPAPEAAKPDRRHWWRCSRCGFERQWIEPGTCTCGSSAWQVIDGPTAQAEPAYATVAQLEEIVRETAARYYHAYEAPYAYSDMRAVAKTRDGGGFWSACERVMPADIGMGGYRRGDLAQAINNVASQMEATAVQAIAEPAAGRPLMEVIKTDAELADDAWRADIASRQAAAEEAERQVDADARARQVRVLQDAIDALPAIGRQIKQVGHAESVISSLVMIRLALETPAPAADLPASELPADLVAAGWTMEQRRGKWFAAVAVATEAQPITTQGRREIGDCIRDAVYLHKNLRIGVSA